MNANNIISEQQLKFPSSSLLLGSILFVSVGIFLIIDRLSGHNHVTLIVLMSPIIILLSILPLLRLGHTQERSPKIDDTEDLHLSYMVQSAVTAIVTLDREGNFTTWNYGAEQLFGYDARDVTGQSLSLLLGSGQAAQVEMSWLLHTIRREGFVDQHETACYRADGRRIMTTLTGTASAQDTQDIFIVIQDITRRKRLEQETNRINIRLKEQATAQTQELAEKIDQLALANAELRQLDQTRSEFVSLVSHQIRAPLTNMVGSMQRMQADCQWINATCSRMFKVFEQQVNRLDHLVQDVLNATRIESGQLSYLFEPTSIPSILRQAAQQAYTRTPARQIHLTDKPGLPLVYVDRDRVVEVLLNLLDNADKYSPPGEDIYIEARADQSKVTVSVRDCGGGIPVEDQGRLFDKFYRADSSDSQQTYGYGLGLYICRRLIEAQNGHIWAENHPEGGAVFSFVLPVWQE